MTKRKDIAVIGMSGAFPMSPTLDAFWDNLAAGRRCVGKLPLERWGYEREESRPAGWETAGVYPHMGVLQGAELFDPAFFSISPAFFATERPAGMPCQHREDLQLLLGHVHQGAVQRDLATREVDHERADLDHVFDAALVAAADERRDAG